MDSTNQIIRDFEIISYNKIKIILTNGEIYFSDISFFKDVYCYPTEKEWINCSIDSFGKDIIWSTRFELHLDQLISCSYSTEKEIKAS